MGALRKDVKGHHEVKEKLLLKCKGEQRANPRSRKNVMVFAQTHNQWKILDKIQPERGVGTVISSILMTMKWGSTSHR